jgi:hypothetical protein
MDVLLNTWKDSLAMIPWLLGIYVALEIVGHKYESVITNKISHRQSMAPVLGALFGCIPQCGFSVIASALYTKRCISLGTLLAVFLSTSDEAIPVILAQKGHAHTVFGIIGAKVIIAIIAGYAVDFFSKREVHEETHPPHDPASCAGEHRHCSCHSHSCREPWWKTYVLFPVKHTARVFIFLFAVSLSLGLLVAWVGPENMGKIFLGNTIFQPVLTVLVGLIPNCAASVVIAQLYLKGGITFGSAIAGLCASAGFGLLVLIKENKDTRETVKIIGLLAGTSLLAGLILNFL